MSCDWGETLSLTVITFDNVEAAQRALATLNGQDIYAGCCTLKIDYSKVGTELSAYTCILQWCTNCIIWHSSMLHLNIALLNKNAFSIEHVLVQNTLQLARNFGVPAAFYFAFHLRSNNVFPVRLLLSSTVHLNILQNPTPVYVFFNNHK